MRIHKNEKKPKLITTGYPVEANNTSVLLPSCSIDDHCASPWENVSV